MKMRLDRHNPKVRIGFRAGQDSAEKFDEIIKQSREFYRGKLEGVPTRTDGFEAIVNYVWQLLDTKRVTIQDVYEME